jgi:hypothetical protein
MVAAMLLMFAMAGLVPFFVAVRLPPQEPRSTC